MSKRTRAARTPPITTPKPVTLNPLAFYKLLHEERRLIDNANAQIAQLQQTVQDRIATLRTQLDADRRALLVALQADYPGLVVDDVSYRADETTHQLIPVDRSHA